MNENVRYITRSKNMNEEEFLNRLINKIAKEFGYDAASTLKLIVMTKDKQVEHEEKK